MLNITVHLIRTRQCTVQSKLFRLCPYQNRINLNNGQEEQLFICRICQLDKTCNIDHLGDRLIE